MMRKMLRGVAVAVVIAACGSSNTPKQGQQPDAGSSPQVCGDGVCWPVEVNTCPQDCGDHNGPRCGDGTCSSAETSDTCPQDCAGPGSGSGSGSLDCNDPNVQDSCSFCLFLGLCDGVDPNACAVCLGGGDTACTGGAPDGVCDANESNATCPTDCP